MFCTWSWLQEFSPSRHLNAISPGDLPALCLTHCLRNCGAQTWRCVWLPALECRRMIRWTLHCTLVLLLTFQSANIFPVEHLWLNCHWGVKCLILPEVSLNGFRFKADWMTFAAIKFANWREVTEINWSNIMLSIEIKWIEALKHKINLNYITTFSSCWLVNKLHRPYKEQEVNSWEMGGVLWARYGRQI